MKLLAPCGIDCGICELHTISEEDELFKDLVEMGIAENKLPCPGCRAVKGKCPALSNTCETYLCLKDHDLDYCFECDEFPCVKLHPAMDRSSLHPHNLKIYNLCQLMNKGPEAFISESPGYKKRYLDGKVTVGKGPEV
jgi:hypothetical protein